MKRSAPLRAKPKAPAAPRERRLPSVPALRQAGHRAIMATPVSFAVSMAVAKPSTFRSDAWLQAVRGLPCCVRCGTPGVEAAHRNEGKGGAIKAHDCWTAALCPTCHREIDQGKDMSRDERHAEIDRAILLTIALLALAGRLCIR